MQSVTKNIETRVKSREIHEKFKYHTRYANSVTMIVLKKFFEHDFEGEEGKGLIL